MGLILLLTAAWANTQDQSAPWHLAGWKARAVVEVTGRSPDADCDTAAVRVLCLGRAKADGGDYRVLDAAGRPVPFQLAFHDAGRYSLIAFRCQQPGEKLYVYFDNPSAPAPAELVAADLTPGSGPPKASWSPRHGVVYTTLKRPEADNPETADAMAKLIADSPGKCGGQFQRRISDGYNPFGPSDYYISVYRGWIRIPRAGTYRFCTVSNEASFSFIDGRELVHWPGRHTIERGSRGEKNAQVELTAGLHYIEYYHEEVTLQQMAFLGWRQSGDDGPFDAIPESIFTSPHSAVVSRYERPSGPLLHFESKVVDSVWPTQRHEGQYTRAEFRVGVAPALPDGTTYRWDFGDGQTASGAQASHVFLAVGQYNVTLTADGPAGQQTASWPLEVFEIQHAIDQFPEGHPADYLIIARQYDRSRLGAGSLRELAHLFAEQEDPAGAIDVAKGYLDRFTGADVVAAARVRRLIADCSIQLGGEAIDEAIANYQASIIAETSAPEKLDVLARLIRLVGIDRNLPDKAGQILEQVEQTVRGARRDEETLAAYRRAVIAAADVLLWSGKRDGANELYRRSETLTGRFIPPQVRSARTGAYPGEIREHIAKTNYGAAIAVVDEWEDAFPTDKLKGETFFWRGKLLALRGEHRGACRYLARSAGLAVGAVFETECRLILADSLAAIGKADESRRELAKLAALGLDDKFVAAARERLKDTADPAKK